MNIENIVIDEKKVKEIRRKIYTREVLNIKTQNKKENEIKKEIKRVIESEVDKCY
ncbi:hypothetical protein NMU03_00055 [Allocoprobacillus halotolerans]|uniref:Uncharacterized protein n=1 Tax=Allocoprobacillus halotolerans TaxID=2944914 RepID=A0ABY5I5D7_9FIRM|nr:hypothetical protein [Allocoprobacillus halotolerans]UTY39268.1 hypothetical protein NMU03_00055 [Allocoprobacillus halotolerans]